LSRTRWTRSLAAAAAVAVLACGITLREPLVDWWLGSHGGSHADSDSAGAAHYTCSMDPSVRAREPGQCPICGMALTPVTEQQRGSDLVHVDGASLQRVGVRLATVDERSLRRRLVAVGAVTEAAAAEGTAARVDARVDQASEMESGLPVAVLLPALPLVELGGTIEEVSPDPDTGGARLRVAVQDAGSLLRPGMHAEVHIHIDLPASLVVPARAVIVAGERRIVFVDRGKGLFAPRAIATGAQEGGFIQVRKGLQAGDRVAMSGTFLLAAENRIRSSGALWTDAEKRPAVKLEEKP
jgi:Heavy metal binding domain